MKTMIQIESMLQEKRKELKKLIAVIEKGKIDKPEGSLRVVRDRKHYSYYHYLPAEVDRYPVGKYIPKGKMDFIQSLAQKDYDEKVLSWARNCLREVEKLLAVYRDHWCADFYDKLCDGRKNLVTPYELPRNMVVEKWMKKPYVGKEIRLGSIHFITDKGETVRSKSEKILADYFYKREIPYKYECPLLLKNFGTVYPDFTLLNKKTGQVFYWEHFGMMDNPEYYEKTIQKINGYEENGIFPGKNLLLSYEVKNDLNMCAVEALVQEFLL